MCYEAAFSKSGDVGLSFEKAREEENTCAA